MLQDCQKSAVIKRPMPHAHVFMTQMRITEGIKNSAKKETSH